VTAREKARRQRQLARDILENMGCDCSEADNSPSFCACGGDGEGAFEGCWACQAYTALHGYGRPLVEHRERARKTRAL
jgi:hypothetical protein